MFKSELIEPTAGDKRNVRQGTQGQFKESHDAGKSPAQDRRQKAKTVAKRHEGDRGDRKRA